MATIMVVTMLTMVNVLVVVIWGWNHGGWDNGAIYCGDD